MLILASAWEDHAKLFAEIRIALGLKKSVPSAAFEIYEIGDRRYI